MQAPESLTPEQVRTLQSTHTCLKSLIVYLETYLSVVADSDEFILKNHLGFAALCDQKLLEHFEFVREWEERGHRGK